MTQLFDTATYDDDDEAPERHLRSIPAGESASTGRSTQWQLDDQTIEAGRKGIARARQALRDASKSTKQADRRAA